MAKTTNGKPKKDASGPGLAVVEPPKPPEPSEEPELLEEEVESTEVTETANKEDLDKRDEKRGRGSTRPGSVGFFQRLKNHSPEEWENSLLLYLYRLAPITDRLATGNQYKYIAKFSEPIDEDTILKNELWGGSGTYRVTLNLKEPTGKSKIEDQVQVEIENRAYPPRVPAGEWMDDPRNKRWAWAREPGTVNGTAAAPAVNPVQTVRDTISAVKEISEFVQGSSKPDPSQITGTHLVELLKTTLTAQPNMLETIQGVLAIAKPPAQDNTIATLLMAQLKASQEDAKAAKEREFKLLEKMLDKANTPPPAPPTMDTQLEQTAKIIEAVDKIRGKEEGGTAEARSKMNGWQEFFQPITVEFLKMVTPLAAAGGQLMMAKAVQEQRKGINQQPGQPAARPPQQPQPIGAQPQQPQTQQQQPAAAPAEPEAQQQPEQPQEQQQMNPQDLQQQYQNQVLSMCLNRYLQRILDNIEDPEECESGSFLAASMCDDVIPLGNLPPFKIRGYDAFKGAKLAGKTTILQQFMSSTQLWAKVAGTPAQQKRFEQYIDEFLAYDPDAEDDGGLIK